MATTVTIPARTLQPGQRTIGPRAVPAGASSFQLTATASQAVAAGNSVVLDVQESLDGGATWKSVVSSPWIGGGNFGGSGEGDPPALSLGQAFFVGDPNGDYAPDTSRPAIEVQLVVTITGAALAVSGGTLTVT